MLSIIIPALNEEKYLPGLLSSIRRQDFKRYEIIVADASSRDNTAAIAKQYGCRVVPGGSPARGRNEGAKQAKGDLLLFLDADVVLPDGFLRQILGKFRTQDLDLASVGFDTIEKKKIYQIGSKVWNIYFKAHQYFLPCASGFCFLAKRDLHERLGGFDEDIKVGEDFVYARRAKKAKNKFYFFYSLRCFTSARRFETEGTLKTVMKYVLIDLYMFIHGPVKSDIFKYKFDHYHRKNREKSIVS